MQGFEFNVRYDPTTEKMYILDSEEEEMVMYFAEDEEMILDCLKDYIENFTDLD